MACGGQAVGEAPIGAAAAIVPASGGSAFTEAVSEAAVIMDGLAVTATYRMTAVEALALIDAATAPGGVVADALGESIVLSADYAASGVWNVVVSDPGGWAISPPAEGVWAAVPAAEGVWSKH